MDRIYISATAQHAGKTTTSLGLYRLFEKLGKTISYIKPVGQRSLNYQGHEVDEDAILFKENLKCPTPIDAMTAVTVPKGFTEEYIFNRNKARIYDDIDQAVMKLDEYADVTIIEGTGHAGVGSVFDASNAAVACLMGAKAVIISGGGIGKCLDQIALNQALFQQENVELLGVVINKVLHEKYDKIKRVVGQGLKNMGIECLGVIPYEPELTFPTVEQLVHDCKFELLSNDSFLQNHVQYNIITAVQPEKISNQLNADTMLIVPGACKELLNATLNDLINKNLLSQISCILFADAEKPSDTELTHLQSLNIPVLYTNKDTFKVSANLGELIVKISPRDTVKVDNACHLMENYLDIDKITTLLQA